MFKCRLCQTELAAQSAPCPNPLCVLYANPPSPSVESFDVSHLILPIFGQVMEKISADKLERETVLERLTVAVVRSGFIYDPKGQGPEEWAEAVVGLALALRSKLDNVAVKETAEAESARTEVLESMPRR